MRKAHHKVALITMGSAMLIASGAAMAGPPTAYGAWSVSGGAIAPTSPCPTGFTCGAAITGDGFFQRQITDSVGTQYFQTIITPVGATATSGALSGLAFTDENFVQQAGGTGIADQQNVSAPSTTANPGVFTSTTAINSGWAQGAGENAIDLVQTVDDSAATAPFTLAFTLTDASTNNTAPVVGINESVSLYSPGNPNSSPTDKQVFNLKQLKGPASPTSVSLTGATDSTGAGSIVGGVGTVNWVQGDLIQAMWMGQVVTSGTGGTQAFGVQTYTNVDGATDAGSITLVDQSAIGSAGA
ncbi:MAG: hypothetical protein P8173_17705, partial [Gammaproteobacteria bacterium]